MQSVPREVSYDAALGAEDTSRAAVVDLSHGGRVRVAGEGRRAFLVRETTYGGRPGELAMVGGAGEALLGGLPDEFVVWMSHGDKVRRRRA